MQRGIVYLNTIKAGFLERTDEGKFIFQYENDYFLNKNMPAISINLPKSQVKFESTVLFPFFYGLLAEGVNKEIQCRLWKIDGEDDFTCLLKTAGSDTIGAIAIKEDI